MGAYQFIDRQFHILIIISYDDDVVGIMGDAGSDGSAVKPEPGQDADSGSAGSLMPLDHGNLIEFSVCLELLLSRNPAYKILRGDLPFLHLDDMRTLPLQRKFQAFF